MLLDGKAIANTLLARYEKQIASLARQPGLAVVLVGDHAPSRTYVSMKEKACKKIGIASPLLELPSTITEEELINHIIRLNQDESIDGILVQLPLPGHINEKRVMQAIDPTKDVDGFHPVNLGKLMTGDESGFIPCTPLGIATLLKESGISTVSKHVVIVGRSNIVGKPLANLLIQKRDDANATVTLVHSRTQNLSAYTKQADILVAAMGAPRFIRKEMVKEGAVVIDVGISRDEGCLVGDVDFDEVEPKCHAITPVPGGVGPMTVAMLMHNTVLSCERRCVG